MAFILLFDKPKSFTLENDIAILFKYFVTVIGGNWVSRLFELNTFVLLAKLFA